MIAAIIDDFLRTPTNGMVHHIRNLLWLTEIAKSLSNDTLHITTPKLDTSLYMDALSLPRSRDGWLKAIDTEPTQSYLQHLREDISAVDIVIGFGLSNTTIRALDQLGIPFVDIEISPIRFLDDLGLDVRTNIPALANSTHMELNSDEVEFTAAIIRGQYTRSAYDTIPENVGKVGVIFGQMNFDSALVDSGRFARFNHHTDTIKKWAEELDHILFRPHPYAEDLLHYYDIKKILPSVRPTLVNSYQLLASGGVDKIMAISSGILQEASYFKPETTRLISLYRRRTNHPSCVYTTLDVLRGEVLGSALRGVPIPGPSRRNYQLRRQIRATWGATDEVSKPDFLSPPVPFRSKFVRHPARNLHRLVRRLAS